jgi:hypothetical protein
MQVNQYEPIKLTYQGETLTVKEWAKKKGLAVTTIMSRLDRGDDIERALRSSQKHPSKMQAMRYLDECSIENLPPIILKKIKEVKYRYNRYGNYMQQMHRDVFDKWYEEDFKHRTT